jgi:glycerol dehydrogenase-like iron-containing ADH family enzyme
VTFDWRDGERTIHFGAGRLAEAVELLGGPGFTLLTTKRAAAQAARIAEAAGARHDIPAGRVDEIAGALLDEVRGELIVALGGGRVIDTAKAVVAARGGRAAAIPTTLSGAEMTSGHRLALGSPKGTRHVRPALVVFDPRLAPTPSRRWQPARRRG